MKEAQQRREKSIMSYKLKAASFEAGRSRLSQEALKNIDELAERIKAGDWKMITVEGHTDSTGLEAQNRILAEQRATAVYMELLKCGIPANKARVSAFGSSMPIADNATPEGRAANRRVEIFVE
jgi:outer membrane protein OmpA-like peptidoglycan-associated protein